MKRNRRKARVPYKRLVIISLYMFMSSCQAQTLLFYHDDYEYSVEPKLLVGNYYEAQNKCKEMNSEIFHITSKESNEFLLNILRNTNVKSYTKFWLNMRRVISNNEFFWKNGKPVNEGFTNWDKNRSNILTEDKNCAVATWKNYSLKWSDVPCQNRKFNVICQKKLEIRIEISENSYNPLIEAQNEVNGSDTDLENGTTASENTTSIREEDPDDDGNSSNVVIYVIVGVVGALLIMIAIAVSIRRSFKNKKPKQGKKKKKKKKKEQPPKTTSDENKKEDMEAKLRDLVKELDKDPEYKEYEAEEENYDGVDKTEAYVYTEDSSVYNTAIESSTGQGQMKSIPIAE